MYKKQIFKRKIIDHILTVILVIAFILFLIMIFCPYKPFVVVSDSMVPVLPVKSVIIGEKYEGGVLKAGDIITYQNPEIPIPITHRIIEVRDDGYIVKGDNLDKPDDNIVLNNWVKYRIVWCNRSTVLRNSLI